jgi:hypothetical protein
MATTIQVSDELRKRLKIMSSYLDITYEELIKRFIEIYENEVPFKSESEFSSWFEENLDLFGFKNILVKNLGRTPDYVVEDYSGKKVNVKIELVVSAVLQRRYNGVDVIVAAYSTQETIDGIPVLTPKLIPVSVYKKGLKQLMVQIPDELWEKLLKRALKKYGCYDGIRKTVTEALEKLLRDGK